MERTPTPPAPARRLDRMDAAATPAGSRARGLPWGFVLAFAIVAALLLVARPARR